jgi:phage/plasmid primase-like uncharacterized protein
MKYAREAAQAVGGFLAVPNFGGDRPERVSAFNDLRRSAGPEAVRACIERAAPVERSEGPEDEDADDLDADKEIARLGKLRTVDYEQVRKEAAAKAKHSRFHTGQARRRRAIPGRVRAGQGTPFGPPSTGAMA